MKSGRNKVRGEELMALTFPVILGWCKQDSITTRLWATRSDPISAAAACFPTPQDGPGPSELEDIDVTKGASVQKSVLLQSNVRRQYFLFVKPYVMRAQPRQEVLAFPQSLLSFRAHGQTP